MKLYVGVLFFIAFVAPSVFAAEFLELDDLEAASQALQNSPKSSPMAIEIFYDLTAGLDRTKSCLDRADLGCMLLLFKQEAGGNYRVGVEDSLKTLELFEKLSTLGEKAVTDLEAAQKNNDGKAGVKVSRNTLEEMAKEVNQFLGK